MMPTELCTYAKRMLNYPRKSKMKQKPYSAGTSIVCLQYLQKDHPNPFHDVVRQAVHSLGRDIPHLSDQL